MPERVIQVHVRAGFIRKSVAWIPGVVQVAAEHLGAGLERLAAAGVPLDALAWMADLPDRCRTGAA